MRALLVFPLLSVALLGCPPKDQSATPPPPQPASQPATPTSTTSMKSAPNDREHVDADGIVRRGIALSQSAALSVGEVMAKADGLAGQSVKVSGKVDTVCEKAGCWFVIKDGEQSIRITAKDYGFFVPSKAPGMQATIEGELSVKTLSQAEIDHLKAEGAKLASNKEVAIEAAGVEMKQAG